MAGGTFSKLSGKTRPGTYINFESTRHDAVGISERGTVIIPLPNHTWGPSGEFIMLTNASPDAEITKLGYSIYDEDPNRQMLLIREAFKKAQKVYVYRLNAGTKATVTATLNSGSDAVSLTATAAYGGTRGNALSFAIVSNPLGGFDVQVYLDGNLVSEYAGLTTIAQLIAEGNAYITFTGSGNLAALAGATLTGGTDTAAQNSDVSAFADKWENVKFNTVAFPLTDSTLQSMAKAKIKYLRENMGRGVQVVMPDTLANDYEGVISVTNSVKVGETSLSHAEACAWAAAATAAAGETKSNTYEIYEGAVEVVDKKSNEEAIAAINNGEFFFSDSESGDVVVEYDINTLKTFSGGKDKTYRKNRVIRVFDAFAESIQLNFPPNKYANSTLGWDIMEGVGRSILKRFFDAGAITNVDYDNDFLVDRSMSQGDETYFNVGLQVVDSAEKLYFTIGTR